MNNDKYFWTEHAKMKMRHYGLSEQRVRRVIRAPFRIEEGIAEKTIACMQPLSIKADKENPKEKKWKQEIWVMYAIKCKNQKSKCKMTNQNAKFGKIVNLNHKQLKVISAWRYPGVSPKNDPIPDEIRRELAGLVY